MSGPKIYVFDAYGTLFDVHSAVARHGEALGDALGERAQALSDLWRAKQLEYTWTRSLMGQYRDFRALTEEALDFAGARFGGISAGLRAQLLDAYETLDAFPDAAPALKALKARGCATAILSNGSPAMLENAMRAAGLADLIDACLSVDAVRVFKTAPEAYALATDHFNALPGAISFQSSNRWDIAGAARFGFETVWINRAGQPDEYPDLAPRRVLPSLADLAA